MGSRLQAVGVSFSYPGDIKALDRVHFDAGPGEFVALLGPNGSGKSTLLRHFNGLLKAAEGRVLIDDRDIGTADATWLHRTVGFVFQDPNDQLFAATVSEDIAFGPRNMDLPAPEVLKRVETALDLVGLPGFGGRPVHSLSFGQKRRVALAGVLAMQPSALVLDEPTAGLDPAGASRLMALLHLLNRQKGVTVVAATHDIDLVPAYARRVHVICEGRLVASGPPSRVFADAEMIRQSGLRIPRTTQLLNLIDVELGQSLAGLPITLEDGLPLHRKGRRIAPAAERGFTTGAAAAAAAGAASELLFHGTKASTIELRSPVGTVLEIRVHRVWDGEEVGLVCAGASVIKEGGGPADITVGAEICATVRETETPGIAINGGAGIGIVAKHGLPVPMGSAAINPVPQQMIVDAVTTFMPPGKGAVVTISVVGGEELASRTLNPAEGIVGGIAILGTTGLIEDLACEESDE